MSKQNLTEVKMGGNGCSSYLGSVDGVLTAANMWNDDFYKLAGMTGIAFIFIIHEETCPSSLTVYDWQEHFAMMDRIGVQSEIFQYYYNPNLNTYNLVQNRAIERIKESLGRGVGVVIWTPTPLLEFGIITGYDDEQGIFTVKDVTGQEDPDPLLYSNLGISEVPVLFYQIFYDRIEVLSHKTYWESLIYGVKEWNKEYHVSPYYGSGKKAYLNLLTALKKRKYNGFGLSYIIFSYNKAKKCAAEYLNFLATEVNIFAGLTTAAELFRQVSQNFVQLAELIPFPSEEAVASEKLTKILQIVEKSLELENKAMDIINNYIDKNVGQNDEIIY